jgi:hypothetical protein
MAEPVELKAPELGKVAYNTHLTAGVRLTAAVLPPSRLGISAFA